MKTFKLTLKPISYLLTASGEGSALIDADAVFHKNGFPYIPARRVKGMLKESMKEVLEIRGENESVINTQIESLFGKSGAIEPEGKLRFGNFYLNEWDDIKKEISKYKDLHAFQPDNIQTFFTTEIQQTSVENDGVAKEKSLRNYRVLKPVYQYEGTVDCKGDLTDMEKFHFESACLNLRYAGTRRNRGFGKIKLEADFNQEKEKPAEENDSSKGSISETNKLVYEKGKRDAFITIEITTKAPVILAKQLGEQNTVFTETSFSGNQLRGILASEFIRNFMNGKTQSAYTNDHFFRFFLSDDLVYSPLCLENTGSIPLNIHGFKGYDDKGLVDVFDRDKLPDEEKHLITKPIKKSGVFAENKYRKSEPSTSFFFHNSRENRSAGRSTKDQTEGGIFYYEAIDEDQVFNGKITGSEVLLTELARHFNEPIHTQTGKSRSAQYGDVVISLGEVKEIDNTNESGKGSDSSLKKDRYLLTLQSPLILFNDFGFPEPTIVEFKKALKGVLSQAKFIIPKSAVMHTFIEQYNSVWKSKSGKMNAFKEGSVFVVETEGNSAFQMPEEILLGELQEQGFGKIKIEPYERDGKDAKRYGLFKEKDSHQKSVHAEKNAETATNIILKDIIKDFGEKSKKTEIKTRAVSDAGKYKSKLKGHLIGRLEMMIKEAASSEIDGFQYVNKWIEDIKGKPAEESLKAAKLMDDFGNFNFKMNYESFEECKIYWLTLLQTLRKLNKHGE
jgi:CRISPR-associated protein Csx10